MIPIDFSQITHAAERRTNNLKDLQMLMRNTPDVLAAAQQVKDFTLALEAVWQTLDPEGRAMLPELMQRWMSHLSTLKNQAVYVVGCSAGAQGVLALSALVGETA